MKLRNSTFNNNLTLLRNSTFDVTWTHILTNKVLELVSKLVVHSSIINYYTVVTGNDLQLRSRKNRKLLTPLRFGCFGRNVKKYHLPVSGNPARRTSNHYRSIIGHCCVTEYKHRSRINIPETQTQYRLIRTLVYPYFCRYTLSPLPFATLAKADFLGFANQLQNSPMANGEAL